MCHNLAIWLFVGNLHVFSFSSIKGLHNTHFHAVVTTEECKWNRYLNLWIVFPFLLQHPLGNSLPSVPLTIMCFLPGLEIDVSFTAIDHKLLDQTCQKDCDFIANGRWILVANFLLIWTCLATNLRFPLASYCFLWTLPPLSRQSCKCSMSWIQCCIFLCFHLLYCLLHSFSPLTASLPVRRSN